MLARQLLFAGLIALPTFVFLVLSRRASLLATLPVALVGGWWAASPVTYPRWIPHGFARAVPIAAFQTLALWLWTR